MTHSAAAGPRPSRRAIVRGAAGACPSSPSRSRRPRLRRPGPPARSHPVSPSSGGPAQDKHVSWDLSLTNGPVPIASISITVTYAPNSKGQFTTPEVYGYSATGPRDTTWTATPVPGAPLSITVTHGSIPASSTTNIHTDFAGGDNAAGTVTATATITYVGTSVTSTQTLVPVEWKPGDEHVHPLTGS